MFKTMSSQSLPSIKNEHESELEFFEQYNQLKSKKEALEEALNLKLIQLKSLCLKEAELVGKLPAETPLNPQEPLPTIRRRVGTEFHLNNTFLSKVESTNEEELARLEVEIELQRKIVKANFKLSNEMNLKKSLKKKRIQNYHEAIIKLKEMEKKLIDLKTKGECNGFDKDSNSSVKLDHDVVDRASLSTSSLSTPSLRETKLPLSFIPISPVSRRCNSFNSAHLQEPEQENLPQRSNTADHFRHRDDSCSVESSSSCESDVFRISNDNKRRNILSLLQAPHSDESIDLVASHIYSMPTKVPSFEHSSGYIESFSQNNQESLDTTRRKSYISAIQSHIQLNLPEQHKSSKVSRPGNNRTSISTFTSSQINMAQRPLPSPPPPSPPLSPISSLSMERLSIFADNEIYQNIDDKGTFDKPDISHKAVRSSIVRTPICVNRSTPSKDIKTSPSPVPMLPPRNIATKDSLYENTIPLYENSNCLSANSRYSGIDINLRGSEIINSSLNSLRTDCLSNERSKKMFWSQNSKQDFLRGKNSESTTSTFPVKKGWIETCIDSDFSCDTSSLSRLIKEDNESRRPPSIPLSPTLPAANLLNGVEVNVLSVGQFQPYWEETKPYELSDFYKYSTKHRNREGKKSEQSSGTRGNNNEERIKTKNESIELYENETKLPTLV